ncbi:MAG: N-acetyltransferase [Ignavibacteriales bacterium]|nr:MAG: N-acetyltransferase [Ignavibacteriales bacterium]
MIYEINKSVFDKFPEIDSKNLLYRNITPEDCNEIFKIRSNDKVMTYLDTTKHNSVEDSKKMIEAVIESYKNKTGINWAIIKKESRAFVGYFGYWRIITEHCRAEIGYALKPEYWGQGIMAETLTAMIEFGFNTLMLHSIEANVNPGNTASIKVLEKAGFKKEAYFRENFLFDNKFLDSIIYSLLEKDLHK